MRRARNLAIAAIVSAGMLATASAAAKERVVTIKGVDGPGPSKYDKTYVTKFGPSSAKNVLVLMPGYEGGAGDFTLTGRYLTSKIPNLQVWEIDRRSHALEDVGAFRKALAGNATLQQTFDHYLGWILHPSTPADHFNFLVPSTVQFAKRWGLPLALGDERKVVLAARDGGRRNVILGGHSLGASMTAAYAAWDFNGHPGYEDVDGLVLIDGGLLGSFDAYDRQQAKDAIANLEAGVSPFVDLLGLGFPEAAGLFAEVGGIYARKAPTAAATTLQGFPLLPPQFNPPFPVTDRALLGYAFDRDTSPAELGRWRSHPRLPSRDLQPGAVERCRVVLPAEVDDRRQRCRPAEAERGGQVPRPAAEAPEAGRRPALRDQTDLTTAMSCWARSGSSRSRRRPSRSRSWSTPTPSRATSTR